jgi:hypothetical protein
VKLQVEVDQIVANITFDGAWTPELLATLLRHCGDEVVRVCQALDDEEPAETGETTGPDASTPE